MTLEEENKALRDAIEWVIKDMNYTAPEMIPTKVPIWCGRLKRGLES